MPQDRNADDQQFPGYPHYRDSEDIMNRTDETRVPMSDGEGKTSGVPETRTDNDSDITAEEASLLDNAGGESADEEQLAGAMLDDTDDDGDPLNETNVESDLDVPGDENDNDNESIGEEDEENNFYSLGGDRHESQEERQD